MSITYNKTETKTQEIFMRNYIISTETTCDLPMQVLNENNIYTINMKYSVNNVEYGTDKEMTNKEFCDAMRGGANTMTSSVNVYDAKAYFEDLLKEGKDILHICFSSGMSGSCQNIKDVAEELNKTSENKIYVVDSLCACSGQGLLVLLACQKAETTDIKALKEYLDEIRYHVCHFFTVDDLKYLVRGGRVSKTKAQIATLLNIKPVLYVDDEGRIIQYKNVISRKKSVASLCDDLMKRFSGESDLILISHADCLEDAIYLQNLIKQKTGYDSQICELGHVICSHSGPGTLALFFLGNKRF